MDLKKDRKIDVDDKNQYSSFFIISFQRNQRLEDIDATETSRLEGESFVESNNFG